MIHISAGERGRLLRETRYDAYVSHFAISCAGLHDQASPNATDMQDSPLLSREERFRRLFDVVEGPVSRRWALVQVTAFLEELAELGPTAEAYLLPLSGPLVELAGQLDPVGLRPGQLLRPARLVGTLRHRLEGEENEPFARVEQDLRRRAALLLAYGGAPVEAARAVVPEEEFYLEDLPDVSPQERLEVVLRRAPAAATKEELRWVQSQWTREVDEKEALVPVVERLPDWVRREGRSVPPDDPPRVGALRCMRLEVFGPSPTEADELRLARQAVETSFDGPVRGARRLLSRRRPHLSSRSLHGHLSWGGDGEAGAWLEGASAGLAVGSLFFCVALEEARERRRFALRPETSLTGSMGADGAIRPVEQETLPLKVQVAFFSPTRTLAVPEQQKDVAEEALETLKERYPHGRLDIVGAQRLRDVLDHRRLTEKKETPWPTYAVQQAWSRKGGIAGAALVLFLSVALAWQIYGPLDQNPVRARYSGEMMIVENDSGQDIERFEVGEKVVNRFQGGRSKKTVAFADVTGDSKNEVFWVADVDPDDKRQVLRAKAIGADTLLWEKALQFDLSFPQKPEVVGTTFLAEDLLAADLTGDGHPKLYVSTAHSPYFPELLLQLGPRSGTELQRYLHFGYLVTGLYSFDLDTDGTEELLAGGHNHAFGDPVLTVLDPGDMQGHAPTRGSYTVEGMSLAPHHAYLRFPASRVQQVRPKATAMVRNIWFERDPTQIRIEYQDGRGLENTSYRPRILMHLGPDLRPITVGTSSRYDRLGERLVQEGRLDAPPGPEALQRLGGKIQYWTGGEWIAEGRSAED